MRRLLNLFPGRRRRMERELERELSYHIERRVDDLVRGGASEADARRQVAIEFGPRLQIGEDVRDTWLWRWLDEGQRDVQYAIRSLRRSPSFTIATTLTLALGIGASAAIFSVVNAVLLRPLPYKNADRLVLIWSDLQARAVRDFGHPAGDLFDFRQQTTAFDGIAAVQTETVTATIGDAEPERVSVGFITPDFFSLIGANVTLGSDFTEDDGRWLTDAERAGVPLKAILSHEFWQQRFGGRTDVIGSTLQFPFAPILIAGVAEPHVELMFPAGVGVLRKPSLWIAQRLNFATAPRTSISLRLVGRLKPGVTRDQAQAQVNLVTADLRKRFPIKDSAGLYHRVESMYDDLVSDVRAAILVLMGAGLFLLLIACSNIANLLLIRAAGRERELAVRAAIGGSRGRVFRQLLVESLVMSAAGVVLGVGVAAVGVEALLALSPPVLPRLDTVSVDGVVVAFASLLGVASAVLFGTAPALRASTVNAMEALRAGGRSAGPSGTSWLRHGVVIGEVALSLVLLIGAGLMVRSLSALTHMDLGFEPANAQTFSVSNTRLRDAAERETFMQRMQSELRSIPGVTNVTAVNPLPLNENASAGRWGPLTALTNPEEFQQATYFTVLPGYFESTGARLLEGRTFVDGDGHPDRRVVIIDDILAAKAFGSAPAVGQRLLVRPNSNDPVVHEVIGVVKHQRHLTLTGEAREALFLTDGQVGHAAASHWIVRTATGVADGAGIREAVGRVSRQVIVADLQPWSALVARATASTRFSLFLIGVFAAIAIVLATVGLYGVLATAVRQRTSEIGVRMAFGADAASILRMVLSLGLRLSIVGIAAGLVLAVFSTRLMQSMLVGVRPTDLPTFGVIAVGFLVIATCACLLPAQRAARLNPLAALREGQ